jgi:hypothetical protein
MLIVNRDVMLLGNPARLPQPLVDRMIGQRFLQLRSSARSEIVEDTGPRLNTGFLEDPIELSAQVRHVRMVLIDATHRSFIRSLKSLIECLSNLREHRHIP